MLELNTVPTQSSPQSRKEEIVDRHHVNEALALNLITLRAEIAPNLWMPMSYAMVEGTRLQSTTRTDGRKVIQIVGNTTEMAAPFEIVIVAQPQGR